MNKTLNPAKWKSKEIFTEMKNKQMAFAIVYALK